MTKLKFINHSLYQGIAVDAPVEPNSLLFYYNNGWNDYGYIVGFDVLYIDDKLSATKLGKYRIFHSEEDLPSNDKGSNDWNKLKIEPGRLPDELFELEKLDSEHYFSLASSQEFYARLSQILPSEYNDVLNRLNDLTQKDSSTIEKILNAQSLDNNNDIFEKVIFRNFIGEPKSIIELTSLLKQIDNTLTISNYLEWENFEKILNEEQEDTLKKIIEYFSGKSTYKALKAIVDKFIANKSTIKILERKANFILDLIKKAGYEQLAVEFESQLDDTQLSDIRKAVEAIKEQLQYKVKENLDFVHYTTLSTLDILIKKYGKEKDDEPYLRLSNARQMNDPNEGQTLLNLIEFPEESLKNTDYSSSSYFIASMANVEGGLDDSLPMWKQYGGDTSGISLVYSEEYIKGLLKNPEVQIYKVFYLNNLPAVRSEAGDDRESETKPDGTVIDLVEKNLVNIKNTISEMNRAGDADKLEKVLVMIDSIRYLFKEASYSYENEYRIIINRENNREEIRFEKYGNHVPRLYTYVKSVPLSYKKVTLGPKADDIDFVAPYIKYVDNGIEVHKSKIPYR